MDHPLRATLADELHARPFLRISGSVSLTHIAVYADGEATIHEALLRHLCRLTGIAEPIADTNTIRSGGATTSS
ncbi:putative membrane-anchored protein [Paraburkholderia sp. JPY465]